MTNYMLGVDIGTTSTKAVLFTEKGKIIQQENIGYPFTYAGYFNSRTGSRRNISSRIASNFSYNETIRNLRRKSYCSFHLVVQCIA